MDVDEHLLGNKPPGVGGSCLALIDRLSGQHSQVFRSWKLAVIGFTAMLLLLVIDGRANWLLIPVEMHSSQTNFIFHTLVIPGPSLCQERGKELKRLQKCTPWERVFSLCAKAPNI